MPAKLPMLPQGEGRLKGGYRVGRLARGTPVRTSLRRLAGHLTIAVNDSS
jgi:hypothetical protein